MVVTPLASHRERLPHDLSVKRRFGHRLFTTNDRETTGFRGVA
jgi:hypothetical protein